MDATEVLSAQSRKYFEARLGAKFCLKNTQRLAKICLHILIPKFPQKHINQKFTFFSGNNISPG